MARITENSTMRKVVKALPKDGTPMRVVTSTGAYDMTYHGTFTYIGGDGWEAPERACPECGEPTAQRPVDEDSRADVCDECGWTNA